MSIGELREFFGWCTVIHYGLLLWWFACFVQAHDFIYRVHGRWFDIRPERFDSIHYQAMAFYKLAIFVFCLVPYLVLWIIG